MAGRPAHEPAHEAMNTGPLRSLIMVWFLLGGIVGSGLLGPNRPSLEREYGLSHLQFGVLIALVQIGASGAVLLAAPRLSLLDPAAVLIGGLAVQTLGFFVVAAAPGWPGLGSGWAFITGGMVLGSLFNNVSMTLWPQAPRKGINLLHSFNALGKILGPAVAAAFLTFDWRGSFLLVGCLSATVAAAFYRFREHLRATRTAAPSAPLRSLGVLKQPLYWLCVLPFGMISGGEAAFNTLLPAYLQGVRRLPAALASLLLSVHLLGLCAGRLCSAHLGSRFSNGAIIGSCLTAGLWIFPLLLSEDTALTALSLFALGVLFSGTWPTFYAHVAQFLNDHRDMLAYGASLGSFLGIALSIFLSSLVAERSLTLSLLFGPAALWLFGILFYSTALSAPPLGEGEPAARS